MTSPRNTFSEASASYARARPRYPEPLFHWLASQCSRKVAAWDCATGNGQAAVGIAPYFERVIATDVSAAQIEQAAQLANVEYRVASAEACGLPAHQTDLIVVAQALHWFATNAFWQEVRRVAAPGAFFCAFGYAWPHVSPAIDKALVAPFRALVEPYWAENNRLLWDGYQSAAVGCPFPHVSAPAFAIELELSSQQLAEYLMTWSAYKVSRQNADVSAAVDDLLARAVAKIDENEPISVRMPLAILSGRVC
ncbi:MAG: class I SAM-dependent methyltransferase [Myxococcales bacterium]|nr:class I SAM-dependent methyltransferase [Myxococcales bacterium]